MTYNFDEKTNRWGSGCYKWDSMPAEDVIPMWVADMDFRVAQPIIDALNRRVAHGVFGYTKVPERYYDSVISWYSRRHKWHIEREWMMYTSGVVPALSAIVKALTVPGDGVIVQTPVYNCFFSSIRNNGCHVVEAPLRRVPVAGDEGLFTYEMDFDALERACSSDRAKLLILCNPHNPAGRVWKAGELQRLNDICLKHGVRVVADEIHCELVMPGYEYTPFASISDSALDNSITCCSPSKSFNIAGLQMSNIICNDEATRQKIDRAININEICDVNPFGVEAVMAAYDECEDWIVQLNGYISDNYAALRQFFKAEMPQLKVSLLEGTYLVWVYIAPTGMTADALTDRLLSEGRVMVNSGTMYDEGAGNDYIRLNLACPRSQMMEALRRISKVINNR